MPGPARDPAETTELSGEECLRLLAAHSFGRLAVGIGDRVPVIRPLNYAFDERAKVVILRIGEGSTLSAIASHAKAAFEIDGIDEPSRTGWSVIVTGVAEMVNAAAEIERLDRSAPVGWAEGGRTHWVSLRAGRVTGRRITSAAERAANR